MNKIKNNIINKNLKNIFYLNLIFILCLILTPSPVNAEGSKDIVSSGGDRAFLDFSTMSLANLKRRTLIKVYAASGETIHLGSSANGLSGGKIIVTGPDGVVTQSIGTSGAGIINNGAEEIAGPKPNLNGYTPFNIVATTPGVYTVEFHAPVPGNTAGGNNYTASASWSRTIDQPKDQAQVLAWDATVRGTDGQVKIGRVYTNAFAGTMRGGGRSFSTNFYILTKGGWQYTFDGNGMDPWGFIFLSNSAGNMKLKTFESSYSSVDEAKANVYDPDLADNIVTTHKIFFNKPSSDLPENTKSARGNEWLSPAPNVTPGISKFAFTGIEGTLNQMGLGLGGDFTFSSTVEGRYNISIDLNNNKIEDEDTDVTLTGPMKIGENKVYFNGKTNKGDLVLAGSIDSKLIVLKSSYGEVHFPLFDVENNLNGFILVRQNGPNSPDSKLYWNNNAFADKSNFPEGLDNRDGLDSVRGAHKWKNNGGDRRVLDTWGYIKFEPLYLESPINVKHSSLSILRNYNTLVNTTSDKKVLFTLVARNSGPSDIVGATTIHKMPNIVDSVSFEICTIGRDNLPCDNVKNVKIEGNTVSLNLDIKSGDEVTLISKANLNTTADASNVEILAGIIRTKDVYDDEATVISNVIYKNTLEGLKASCVDAGYSSPPCDNYSQVSYKKTVITLTTPTNPTTTNISTSTPVSVPLEGSIKTSTTFASSSAKAITPELEAIKKILKIIYKEDGATLSTDTVEPSTNRVSKISTSSKKIVKGYSKPIVVDKDAKEEFENKIASCKPILKGEVSQKSTVNEINDLKKVLNAVASTTLTLNGIYDEALANAVRDYQNIPLHKLTILKAAGQKEVIGIAGSYTIAQLNLDKCYKNIKNRCPYFYDYATLGDRDGSQNKLQNSTTTQINLWKEFLNQMFPLQELSYNGSYDKSMRSIVGKYQSTYSRVILSPWKTANPKSTVTYYLRESSRNWANYMVKCPEGPIELYDGSGNVNYY
jgi:hypothetical protein